MKTIGMLRVGQYFMLEGRKYRVGHLIDGTNGYVACTDITDEKRKVRRFYIDTSVETVSEVDICGGTNGKALSE